MSLAWVILAIGIGAGLWATGLLAIWIHLEWKLHRLDAPSPLSGEGK